MNFVQVYKAKDEIEARLIKGLFESFGIKSMVSLNSNLLLGYVATTNHPHGVYVDENKAEEAKKVLAERE